MKNEKSEFTAEKKAVVSADSVTVKITSGEVPEGSFTLKFKEGADEAWVYEYTGENDKVGEFTTKNKINRVGNCHMVFQSIAEQEYGAPVETSFQILSLDDYKDDFFKQTIKFDYAEDDLRIQDAPGDNHMVLITKTDAGLVWYPLEISFGNYADLGLTVPATVLPTAQGEGEPAPDAIAPENAVRPGYARYKGMELEQIMSLTEGEGLPFKGIMNVDGPYAIVYFPALACEAGPTYKTYILKHPEQSKERKRSYYEAKKLNKIISSATSQKEKQITNLMSEVKYLKDKLSLLYNTKKD